MNQSNFAKKKEKKETWDFEYKKNQVKCTCVQTTAPSTFRSLISETLLCFPLFYIARTIQINTSQKRRRSLIWGGVTYILEKKGVYNSQNSQKCQRDRPAIRVSTTPQKIYKMVFLFTYLDKLRGWRRVARVKWTRRILKPDKHRERLLELGSCHRGCLVDADQPNASRYKWHVILSYILSSK